MVRKRARESTSVSECKSEKRKKLNSVLDNSQKPRKSSRSFEVIARKSKYGRKETETREISTEDRGTRARRQGCQYAKVPVPSKASTRKQKANKPSKSLTVRSQQGDDKKEVLLKNTREQDKYTKTDCTCKTDDCKKKPDGVGDVSGCGSNSKKPKVAKFSRKRGTKVKQQPTSKPLDCQDGDRMTNENYTGGNNCENKCEISLTLCNTDKQKPTTFKSRNTAAEASGKEYEESTLYPRNEDNKDHVLKGDKEKQVNRKRDSCIVVKTSAAADDDMKPGDELDVKHEKALIGDNESDDSDAMDWEDVEEAEGHQIFLQDEGEHHLADDSSTSAVKLEVSSKNVEISINVSGKKVKRKKTQDDLIKCIERAMNRFNKEVQMNIHKVHLLTLVARGFFRNSICGNLLLKAVCMSHVPSSLITKSTSKWDIADLTKLLTWFQNEFPSLDDVGAIIEKQGQLVKYMKPLNKAEVFVILARSLGLHTRLVISLQPVSMKNGKECKISPKQSAEKISTKAEKSGRTPKRNYVKEETGTPKASRSTKRRKVDGLDKKGKVSWKKKQLSCLDDWSSEKGTAEVSSSGEVFSSPSDGASATTVPSPSTLSFSKPSTSKRKVSEKQNLDTKEDNSQTKISSARGGVTPKKKLRKRRKVKYCVVESGIDSEDEWRSGSENESSGLEEAAGVSGKKKGKSPAVKKTARVSPTTSKSHLDVDLLDDDSDFEVTSKPLVRQWSSQVSKGSKKVQIISDDSDENVKCVVAKRGQTVLGTDVWVEVYLPTSKDWMCIELMSFSVNYPDVCEKYATQPVTYVVAYDNENRLKDVTSRYASNWLSKTHKQRVDSEWWDETLHPYKPNNKRMEERENSLLQAQQQEKPLPQSVTEFKNHPLYVLRRHLLKFEGIYPESPAILGFCRGEAVYSRECVHLLHTREKWMNEARVIQQGETAYKIVKGRMKRNQPVVDPNSVTIDLFGFWQTEEYSPPPAVDGKVPRNEYGNVELFKPSMLPPGTRHIKIPGLHKVARKLGIDAVQAVTGFDFHCGFSHPILDGVVVCEEHVDTLMDAWRQEQQEQTRRKEEKREKRVLGNWKLIVRSLFIRERLKQKYETQESRASSEFGELLEGDELATDNSAVAWPRNMQEGTTSVNAEGHCHVFPKRCHKKDKITGEWTKSCPCGLTLPLEK